MALNLWKVGGEATSYLPAAYGAGTHRTFVSNIGEFQVTFKAKSASGGRVKFDDHGSTALVGWTTPNLTSEYQTFTKTFKIDYKRNLYLFNQDSVVDLYITDFELVEKPLSKLTLNGVDGFLSGNWKVGGNWSGANNSFEIVDDETAIIRSDGANWKDYHIFVPVQANETYTYSAEYLANTAIVVPVRIDNIKDPSTYQTPINIPFNGSMSVGGRVSYTFKTAPDTKFVTIYFQFKDADVITIKRPSLVMGANPIPYEKKKGDRIVLPQPKKNLVPPFSSKLWTLNVNATLLGDTLQLNATAPQQRSFITLTLKPNTVYALSYTKGGTESDYRVKAFTPSWSTLLTTSTSGTFTSPSDGKVVISVENQTSSGLYIFSNVQLEESSVVTSYEPYSTKLNKAPKVKVPKKNLIMPIAQSAVASGSAITILDDYKFTIISSNPYQGRNIRSYVKPNTQYTFSAIYDGKHTVFYKDINGNQLGSVTSTTSPTRTFTTPAGCYIVDIYCEIFTTNYLTTFENLQLEEGDVATSFKPYELVLQNTREGLEFGRNQRIESGNNPSFTGYSVLTYETEITPYASTQNRTLFAKELVCKVRMTSANKIELLLSNNGTSWLGNVSFDYVFNVGQKYKIKIVVDIAANRKLYVNDVLQQTINSSTSQFGNNTNPLIIGSYNASYGDQFYGIVFNAKLTLDSTEVFNYDFTNPSSIVVDKVLQNPVNLIPSYEDSRWVFNANARIYGKDVLRHENISSWIKSYFPIELQEGKQYILICPDMGTIKKCWVRSDSIEGSTQGIIAVNTSSIIFTVQAGKKQCYLGLEESTSGTYEFIRPQLYQLDGKEGTIYGTPNRIYKARKRSLYNKR